MFTELQAPQHTGSYNPPMTTPWLPAGGTVTPQFPQNRLRPQWKGCSYCPEDVPASNSRLVGLAGVAHGTGTMLGSAIRFGTLGLGYNGVEYGNIPTWVWYAMAGLRAVGAGAAGYHGYKRNNSVGWAIWWAFWGGISPLITNGIALAQGWGKRK